LLNLILVIRVIHSANLSTRRATNTGCFEFSMDWSVLVLQKMHIFRIIIRVNSNLSN